MQNLATLVRLAALLSFVYSLALPAMACDSPSDDASGQGGALTGPDAPGASSKAGAFPAFKPHVPTVVASGGPVMKSPRIVPVFFPSTPHQDDLIEFLRKYVASPTWAEQTKEYGIGAASVAEPIQLTQDPVTTGTLGDAAKGTPFSSDSQTLQNDDVRAFMIDQLTSHADVWGPSDAATLDGSLYVLFYPPSVFVQNGENGVVCVGPTGYHDAAQFPNEERYAIYSVSTVCPFAEDAVVDSMGVATSHELLEAVTDPLGAFAGRAYNSLDPEDIGWQLVAGGELGDMCVRTDVDLPAFSVRVDGIPGRVQRMWSNAAARAFHDPCLPAPAGSYFNSAPVLDVLTLGPRNIRAVKIPPGGTATVDVQLFSDGPTGGAWSVEPEDVSALVGAFAGADPADKKLALSFDRGSGKNGDTLRLTITNKAPSTVDPRKPIGVFRLVSKMGDRSSVWFGTVLD